MNSPLTVHMDSRGRFEVIHEGEPPAAPFAPSLREQVERHAAQLRQREMDDAAVAVSRWAGRWVVRCAAQLPLAIERVNGTPLRP